MTKQAPAHRIIMVTCPDMETAQVIAKALVANKEAACVNIVPGLSSVYRWQGRIEQDNELLLLIKSRVEYFDQIARTVAGLHPYELPECISVPILEGSSAYLNWIDESVNHNETNK